jgi:hypothetical protein
MHALVSIYFQKFDTNVEVQDHVLPVIFICEPYGMLVKFVTMETCSELMQTDLIELFSVLIWTNGRLK